MPTPQLFVACEFAHYPSALQDDAWISHGVEPKTVPNLHFSEYITVFTEIVAFYQVYIEAMKSDQEHAICVRMRAKGFTLSKIANALDISTRTVQRWLSPTYTHVPRPLDRSHLRKLDPDQEHGVLNFFRSRNTSTLSEDVTYARTSLREIVSHSTIWRALHRAGITFKKGCIQFQEASRVAQESFFSSLPGRIPDNWIALDEAAFFLNHSRSYAWGPRGDWAVVTRPRYRKRMHSLLLGISPAGVVDWRLYDGAVDSFRFQVFLSNLPACLTVLLDNARTQHARYVFSSQGLLIVPQTADRLDITMRYLPGYSPMLNPTVYCFNAIRTRIGGHRLRSRDGLVHSIRTAIGWLTSGVCSRMLGHTLDR